MTKFIVLLVGVIFTSIGHAQCEDLSNDARQRMQQFLSKCSGQLNSNTGKVAITDFSLNPPKMFIMDQSLSQCAMAIPIQFGVNSQGPPPVAGNVPESHMTPPGFHITKLHFGERYGPENSLALDGTGTENNNSLSRAILIHAKEPTKNTIGCIGVPPEQMVAVMNTLGIGSPVYNHFPQQQEGDSIDNCVGKGGAAGTHPSGGKQSPGRSHNPGTQRDGVR